MFKIIIIILIYLVLTVQSESDFREDIINLDKEQKLVDKLLKKYDKKSRPSGTLSVKFALNLNQIINLIEKDQIMILNAFIDHEWTDKRLTWNPLDFGNISIIRLYGDQIWTPDTFVYSTADHSGFLLPQTGAYFVINYQGANIF
ncbi:neuronal acetylcholine receptor subunit alpha-10-like [Brachionus plicatilis]|uniref:Neuronal acetylcholine receptor subunit alpha-10-like n=1 Tax=Brachionus plicatilis TaxID=10195 RepID=A0A3M7RDI4_BRAPC|nr:neuronal acetylcholine receptor subunit alpha-10-like [Brachionus plicatilis]